MLTKVLKLNISLVTKQKNQKGLLLWSTYTKARELYIFLEIRGKAY